MNKNGKNQFYKKLKVSKETYKAIKLYQKFKYQVMRGFSYFNLEDDNTKQVKPITE